MFLEVIKATYLSDFKLLLEFNDGVSKTVDLKPHLKGKIFEPLQDVTYFQVFSIKFNTVEWENGADFAPEYLYQIGIENKAA